MAASATPPSPAPWRVEPVALGQDGGCFEIRAADNALIAITPPRDLRVAGDAWREDQANAARIVAAGVGG